MQIARTLVVDDDAGFRRRVRQFLASEPSIEVIGEAADGQEAILKARELKPDVVLMDVRMPGTNGVDATRLINDEMPRIKVIVLSLYDVDEYRQAATASGASAYVPKKSLLDELVPTIQRIWRIRRSMTFSRRESDGEMRIGRQGHQHSAHRGQPR